MEYCMEAEARALKSSVRGELTMQKTQVVGLEDFFYMNGLNGAVSGEDFSVDCFFDFNNGEFEEGSVEEEEKLVSISRKGIVTDDDSNSNSSSLSVDSLISNELYVPDDDIAELEWVSQYVDDSLPMGPLSSPAFKQQTESKPVFVKTPCFSSPVPSKARSKRSKSSNRTWSVGSMPMFESLSSTTTSSCASSEVSMSSTNVQTKELVNDFAEPEKKKQKKKQAVQAEFSGGNPFQRRCSHCQVQKTPQWRTGPLGAKTLCNACGVRYKSGRLFPEYRPACSPTFSSDVHSNSHRKVLEMRKKKEVAGPESESSRMVPSF